MKNDMSWPLLIICIKLEIRMKGVIEFWLRYRGMQGDIHLTHFLKAVVGANICNQCLRLHRNKYTCWTCKLKNCLL